jgi:hypothetical protein
LEEGRKELVKKCTEFKSVVQVLDKNIISMLKDQEQQYLKGYSIYVSEKEKELRELVTKLNERFQNNSVKDEIIHSLKQTIKKNYETATR